MAHHTSMQRCVSRWSSRIVPAALVGIVGYVTWAVIALLAVNFLIHPPASSPPRLGAGIAIIVIYFVLFLPMTLSYFRVLQVVVTNPGFVYYQDPSRHKDGSPHEKSAFVEGKGFLDRAAVIEGRVSPPHGLRYFLDMDIFECDIDGFPRWCSSCQQWKHDRSHHSSEAGRCIFKMDHYCPWAGGIISETNFKFFLQFLFYAAAFCTFNLIVCAYFLNLIRNESGSYEVNWIVSLAFAGLFFLFTTGIFGNSLFFALWNLTTIDSFARRTSTCTFAVLIPNATVNKEDTNGNPRETTPPLFRTVTFPTVQRTYAILQTLPGKNPYELESRLENLKTVMGDDWWDWILPIRYSPCCRHYELNDGSESGTRGTSRYKLGPALTFMKREVGLE